MKSALSQNFCDSADRFSLTVFPCVSKITVGYRRQQWTMKTRNGFDYPLLLLYLYPVSSGSFDPIAGEDCLLLLFQNKTAAGEAGTGESARLFDRKRPEERASGRLPPTRSAAAAERRKKP
ncbi:MAG: hypothetical protein IJK35_04195 [Oscillospiraceae bacterium]|nr:hypothetical protein [Oscillospiraceae bacterium]